MSQPVRILVVDDSELIRYTVRAMINRMEPDTAVVVGEAVTGREGVELARQLHPDVVTLDLDMPDMNGVEALKVILEEQPDLFTVLVTNLANSSMALEGLEIGARYVLEKRGLKAEHLAEVLEAYTQDRAKN